MLACFPDPFPMHPSPPPLRTFYHSTPRHAVDRPELTQIRDVACLRTKLHKVNPVGQEFDRHRNLTADTFRDRPLVLVYIYIYIYIYIY